MAPTHAGGQNDVSITVRYVPKHLRHALPVRVKGVTVRCPRRGKDVKLSVVHRSELRVRTVRLVFPMHGHVIVITGVHRLEDVDFGSVGGSIDASIGSRSVSIVVLKPEGSVYAVRGRRDPDAGLEVSVRLLELSLRIDRSGLDQISAINDPRIAGIAQHQIAVSQADIVVLISPPDSVSAMPALRSKRLTPVIPLRRIKRGAVEVVTPHQDPAFAGGGGGRDCIGHLRMEEEE